MLISVFKLWEELWADRRRARLTAALLSVVALLVRVLLSRFAGSGAPYSTFFLATVTSASQGGLGPGVISLLLGALLTAFVVPAGGWGHLIDPADPIGLLRYLVGSAFICWVCEALIRSRDRALAAEQKLQENEIVLRAQADRLRQSNNDLEQFAFVASHDIQEPLRMVTLYSELLVRRASRAGAEDLQICLDQIQNGVERIQMLIRDLLQYSRIIHDEPEIGVADANLAVRRAIEAVRISAEEAGAEILVDNLPEVRISEHQLAQVFQNLLSNAVKYRNHDTRPLITVAAYAEGGFAVFTVRDNGIGFEPESASRIFGLFTRLDVTRRDSTGIGLAICKRIVERSGGTIWAESSPGTGATFFFRIPLGVIAELAITARAGKF